jgi:hypothetical protein
MRHLATNPSALGLTCLWLLDEAVAGHDTFELEFRRIGLGLAWDTMAHLCVVGERYFEHRDHHESVFVVLDEAVVTPAHLVGEAAIPLKDRYRADTLYGPDAPADLALALRNLDGLTRYTHEAHPDAARHLWPTFQDFDTTCGLKLGASLDEQTVHQGLERLLTTLARDPGKDRELIDQEGLTTPRLVFPADLNVKATQEGVSRGQERAAAALWRVCSGLDRSPHYVRPTAEPHQHQPNPITGY